MKDEKHWIEFYKDYTPEKLRIEKINKESEVLILKNRVNRLRELIARWTEIENNELFYKLELKVLAGTKRLLKRECSLVIASGEV